MKETITLELNDLSDFTLGMLLRDLGDIGDEEIDLLWDRIRGEVIKRRGDEWDAYIDDAVMNGVAYMGDLMRSWLEEDVRMMKSLGAQP